MKFYCFVATILATTASARMYNLAQEDAEEAIFDNYQLAQTYAFQANDSTAAADPAPVAQTSSVGGANPNAQSPGDSKRLTSPPVEQRVREYETTAGKPAKTETEAEPEHSRNRNVPMADEHGNRYTIMPVKEKEGKKDCQPIIDAAKQCKKNKDKKKDEEDKDSDDEKDKDDGRIKKWYGRWKDITSGYVRDQTDIRTRTEEEYRLKVEEERKRRELYEQTIIKERKEYELRIKQMEEERIRISHITDEQTRIREETIVKEREERERIEKETIEKRRIEEERIRRITYEQMIKREYEERITEKTRIDTINKEKQIKIIEEQKRKTEEARIKQTELMEKWKRQEAIRVKKEEQRLRKIEIEKTRKETHEYNMRQYEERIRKEKLERKLRIEKETQLREEELSRKHKEWKQSMSKYTEEAESNATEETSTYTGQSTFDMETYVKRLRERQHISRAKAEQEASEARKKYWEQYEARKVTEEENRKKTSKIDQTISKINEQVGSVSTSCETTGQCTEQIAKMRRAAAALKYKLESASTATSAATE